MFKRLLPAALIGYLFVIGVNWGCTKLDTTTLGSDLIPEVDNVNTFADTFDINTSQGFFNDSFKITYAENNVLGSINNDPIFGSIKANMFFQIKPTFFPFYFGNPGDTLLGVDSVVLCLAYVGYWGDSTVPQHLEVFKIQDQEFADSPTHYRPITFQPNFEAGNIGSADVDIRKLKDTLRLRNDSVVNQIRIKLSTAYAQSLFSQDTIHLSGDNGFRNDTLFREYDNGLAVRATGSGNALMYINLADTKTRLQVYFKRKRVGTGALDTTSNSLLINTTDYTANRVSSASNNISRDYSSGTIPTTSSTNLYLATGPGTFGNLTIAGLDTMANKIIHRAEIYMEQDLENVITDSIFSAPPAMYLDLLDSGTTKWKPIYYDLNPNEGYDPDNRLTGYPFYPINGGVNHNYFGGIVRTRVNYLNEKVKYYTFNITRHVQRIVSRNTPAFSMRVYPAYSIRYPQYSTSEIRYDNPVALGRIKVKGGGYPDPLRKMRMVIIWSKLPQ